MREIVCVATVAVCIEQVLPVAFAASGVIEALAKPRIGLTGSVAFVPSSHSRRCAPCDSHANPASRRMQAFSWPHRGSDSNAIRNIRSLRCRSTICAQWACRPTRRCDEQDEKEMCELRTQRGRWIQMRLTLGFALCASLPAHACWDD